MPLSDGSIIRSSLQPRQEIFALLPLGLKLTNHRRKNSHFIFYSVRSAPRAAKLEPLNRRNTSKYEHAGPGLGEPGTGGFKGIRNSCLLPSVCVAVRAHATSAVEERNLRGQDSNFRKSCFVLAGVSPARLIPTMTCIEIVRISLLANLSERSSRF